MEIVTHPPRTLMEVFKGLPEGILVQLINNELVMSPAPKDAHQKMLAKLVAMIYNIVEKECLGEVRCAPYDVYLDNMNAYQPDIVFVANENLHKIKEDGFYGAPDLVIEILSPGTAKYDRNKKKEVYERCGVREYSIIDPVNKSAIGFFLDNDKFIASENNIGTIQSKLLKTFFSF